MSLPDRKTLRLKEYDYSTPGAYFITLCTKGRKCILSEIVGEGLCALPEIILTHAGEVVKKSIEYINNNYVGVRIEKYVIMPNHVHLIVIIDGAGGRGNPPLQSIIGQLKSYTTRFGNILWQRSYYDHIIRNEYDHREIWQYIDTNVLKWEKDCFYNN